MAKVISLETLARMTQDAVIRVYETWAQRIEEVVFYTDFNENNFPAHDELARNIADGEFIIRIQKFGERISATLASSEMQNVDAFISATFIEPYETDVQAWLEIELSRTPAARMGYDVVVDEIPSDVIFVEETAADLVYDEAEAKSLPHSAFILTTVCGREISTMKVDTYEEAKDEMKRQFAETLGLEVEEVYAFLEESDESVCGFNPEFGYGSAYCESANHDNCDWKISEIVV